MPIVQDSGKTVGGGLQQTYDRQGAYLLEEAAGEGMVPGLQYISGRGVLGGTPLGSVRTG